MVVTMFGTSVICYQNFPPMYKAAIQSGHTLGFFIMSQAMPFGRPQSVHLKCPKHVTIISQTVISLPITLYCVQNNMCAFKMSHTMSHTFPLPISGLLILHILSMSSVVGIFLGIFYYVPGQYIQSKLTGAFKTLFRMSQ